MAEDLERRRAEYAFFQLDGWSKMGAEGSALADWLPGLPVMLRTSGLLMALATLRGKDAAKLADAVERWLTRQAPQPPLPNDREDVSFQALCFGADRTAYLAAQWEAIALAQTMKVMAKALLLGKGA